MVTQGFAFCEYVDPNLTEIACQGLNGMELGDRFLVVQRAAMGANARRDGQQPLMMMGMADFASSAPVTAPSILAASAGEGQPTRVLQILNMVSAEELLGDEDYQEIVEDIKEECAKFGTVEEVKIPRPVKTAQGKVDVKLSEAVKDLGKVFVLFEKEEETTKALRAIAGRQFGGESSLLLSPLLPPSFVLRRPLITFVSSTGRVCICAYASLEDFLE